MRREKEFVFLSLGTNIGDRLQNLMKGLLMLDAVKGLEIDAVSSIYESKAIGPKQRDFYNMVISIQTKLSPRNLLNECQKIEKKLGRLKKEKWGPRTIDIDILLYGKQKIKNKDLVIPHEQMVSRRFVLEPLLEISDNQKTIKKNEIKDLLEKVKDQKITKIAKAKDVWSWNS